MLPGIKTSSNVTIIHLAISMRGHERAHAVC